MTCLKQKLSERQKKKEINGQLFTLALAAIIITDGKKQPWSVEETNGLLALWSSTDIQNKLDGAVRTKPVLEKLNNEMLVAGYERSVDQLNNKIKKLKKRLPGPKEGAWEKW